MGTQDREVWVLGSKSLNADRYIQWNDLSYPNFHEPDVLVIDLCSLDEGILKRINQTKFEAARNQIFAKFINGGTVIYIISHRREAIREDLKTTAGRKHNVKVHTRYSNYYLSPIEFQIRTTEGTRIRSYKNEFSPYFKFVKKFNYYLHNFEISSSINDLEASDDFISTIAESLRLRSSVRKDSSKDRLELVTNDIALDNSNHTLSAICSFKVDGYWQSGNAIYLPPTTEISVEESVDVLLQIYGKTTTKETFPEWTYKIELPHMKAVDLKIMNLRKKKVVLEERIITANKQKFELENHYRLLVSKGRALEDAVYEVF